MFYKLPCRTRRHLDLHKMIVCRAVVVNDADIYRPETLNVAVILARLRPAPTVAESSPCNHPSDSCYEEGGQYVCTLCGLCMGNVYEKPMYVFNGSGLTVHRKHFYRPEAYLKTHIKKLGKQLPPWVAGRLHRIWPYIFKLFKRITDEESRNETRLTLV